MTSTRHGATLSDAWRQPRMNAYWIAAAWSRLALIASLISIRVGVSVALLEIVVGAVVGNIPGSDQIVQQTEFTTFLATLGSADLTFLAGAEIDPGSLRRHWRASLSIGVASFALPFVGALLFSRHVLGWTWPAGRDRRSSAEHDIGGRGLCGDGGNGTEPGGLRQADSCRLLRHRSGNRAGAWRAVRRLQLAAHCLHHRHRRPCG